MQSSIFEISIKSVRLPAILLIGVVALSIGCNQQRYKPAPWRAASGQTTLPQDDASSAGGGVRWRDLGPGTMPMRLANGSTLPGRGWSTLPGRGWSTLPGRGWTTLPGRGWSTLPGRGGLTTMPYRGNGASPFRSGGDRFPAPGWSTLPGRGPGANTLPLRQRYPEFRGRDLNWSTLPASSDRRSTPGSLRRFPISTLPSR